MLIEFVLPWKDREPGDRMDTSGGVADILVRRGFAQYVVESVTVKRESETATRKINRVFKGASSNANNRSD